jgi:hypothetical protein
LDNFKSILPTIKGDYTVLLTIQHLEGFKTYSFNNNNFNIKDPDSFSDDLEIMLYNFSHSYELADEVSVVAKYSMGHSVLTGVYNYNNVINNYSSLPLPPDYKDILINYRTNSSTGK